MKIFWFIPTHGDDRYLGTAEGGRLLDFDYLCQIAAAADAQGFYGVLLPTGRSCEDACLVASTLIPEISRLRFLVALERRFSAVLVTHDVEEAVALADRVLVMEGGKLIFETAVDLELPRARSGRVFIDLKERVLAEVMRGR
jgi:alkanesulfonate monooxygenase